MFGFDSNVWIPVLSSVIIAGIALYVRYTRRNDDYWKKRGIPYESRKSLWTFFQLVRNKSLVELVTMYYRKHGKVCGGFEFSKPLVSVADPQLLRDIMVKDFNVFPYRREFKFGDPVSDKMVSNLIGDDWKRVRTIITPAFTSKRMRQMGSIMNECSKPVVECCEKHFKNGEPMDCKWVFGCFTLDVIARAAFATKIDSINDPENIFVKKAKHGFLELSAWRLLLIFLLPMRVLKFFGVVDSEGNDFFKSTVLQVIKERKEKGKRYEDTLQILMDAAYETRHDETPDLNEDETDHFGSVTSSGTTRPVKYKKLSEDELLAQCVLFFLVGYETTASTLCYIAYVLALNPDWQDKLIKEIDEAFAKHDEVNYDVVRDMKLLDAVISETMRMYPVAVGTERTAVEDYKLGDTGIIVEKGMRVSIPIYAMHHDPEYFEEPSKFNPNRFMKDSEIKHPPYSYLPFGEGPRNCLGMRFALMEMKMCIANVLRQYKFQRHPTTKVPLEFKKSGLLSVNELPLSIMKRTEVKT